MTSEELKQIEDLRSLFLDDVPLLDVRAPIEFADGAFPTAVNLPLIDDIERHDIGLTYKEQGQDQAVALGERLVSGGIKAGRIAAWRDYMARHPDAVLYCFRGGMRSQISQRWLLEEAGISCPRVRGGYKAMRRFLIDELARNASLCQPVVVGGRTGVGKTRLLAGLHPALDLERLARHRGSAFGRYARPQPGQVDFENALSIALLKLVAAGNRPFLVEDESRNIGSRHIPPAFYDALQAAPLVLLEASEEERVEITLQEYVHDALADFVELHGNEAGFERWASYLQESLDRIRRRLGGERHRHARGLLQQALDAHRGNGDTTAHRDWIAYLLHTYYDGMYEYQLASKQDRIVFRGGRAAVYEFLFNKYGIAQGEQQD